MWREKDSKSFGDLKRDQLGREKDFLDQVMGSEEELKILAGFEGELGSRRNEFLFKVQSQMEDTSNRLREAEQLVERLKRYLSQLEGIHRILTKK
jgi:hypothetical protein